jgi:hypothetical protein
MVHLLRKGCGGAAATERQQLVDDDRTKWGIILADDAVIGVGHTGNGATRQLLVAITTKKVTAWIHCDRIERFSAYWTLARVFDEQQWTATRVDRMLVVARDSRANLKLSLFVLRRRVVELAVCRVDQAE